ncbi:MAG: hypothetical protein HYS22_03400 [Deltaproteobacteria bacterium]|nr:hypothetical protein [Deltaproteobacteria bacterium]
MTPPVVLDRVSRWFLGEAHADSLPKPEFPEPAPVPPYPGYESFPPAKPSVVVKKEPAGIRAVDLIATGAVGYSVLGAGYHRFRPYADYRAFRNAGWIGISGLLWQTGRAAEELIFEEGGPDPVLNWLLLATMGTAAMNVGVGIGRERILTGMAKRGVLFPEAATVRQIKTLAYTQAGTIGANLALDAVTATHLHERWREEASLETALMLGLQGGATLLFGVGRRDLEQVKLWARRLDNRHVEAVGKAVAERIIRSGVVVDGVTAQDLASDPFWLTALFLHAEGLPEHYTWRAAENSRGKSEGDFASQLVAQEIMNGTGPDGRPLLGVLNDPRSFPPEETLQAVLRSMGREVTTQDFQAAAQRWEAGRWLRWLTESYYSSRVVGLNQRSGLEVEAMPGPSVLHPGTTMEMDELLSIVAKGLEREGRTIRLKETGPVPVGKGVKVYVTADYHFPVNGRDFRVIVHQGTGDPLLLVYEMNRGERRLLDIDVLQGGEVDNAREVVWQRFETNRRHAIEELADYLRVKPEEVESAMGSGRVSLEGSLRDLNNSFHPWHFVKEGESKGRIFLSPLQDAGDPYFRGEYDTFEEAYYALRQSMETEPRNLQTDLRYDGIVIQEGDAAVTIDFTWETLWAIELIYHDIKPGPLYDAIVRDSVEALSRAGAYGTSRGDCTAAQAHHSFTPRTEDGLDTEESFVPAVRVVRRFLENWDPLVAAFPPAPQRRRYIAHPRVPSPEQSQLPLSVYEGKALGEIMSPRWDPKPGETDEAYFVRIARRVEVLWPRHFGAINLDNLIKARAKSRLARGVEGPHTAELSDLLHITNGLRPPPTVEFRVPNTPERMTKGPDGNRYLAIDPEGVNFQRRVWASLFHASANGWPLSSPIR